MAPQSSLVLEVSPTAPSHEPPLTSSAQSRPPEAGSQGLEGPGQGRDRQQASQSRSCFSFSHHQADAPEQPRVIQSPELLMATDSIL